MNAADKRTVLKMINQLLDYTTKIELIQERAKTKMESMTSRSLILGDKQGILQREIDCLDNARIDITSSINQLASSIEF